MKKIIPIKFDKIWGWELWLYSSLNGKETKFEDGTPTTQNGPLVKIIYTNDVLSIQVHPDDVWAKQLENQSNGKSESWYVLDVLNANASLCLGLTTYNSEFIKKSISSNDFEKLLVNKKVHKGDFYNIPAGLVHGIGANVIIFEVQQPSDITYRYFDFNRLDNGKLRELHIEKALKVQKDLSYNLPPTYFTKFTIYENEVGQQIYGKGLYKSHTDSLFINLVNYETFLLSPNEAIEADEFCVIPL